MPKHVFTPEETAKGVGASRRSRSKALREFRKMVKTKEEWEIVKLALTNPAVIGTILFLGVGMLRKQPSAINGGNWISKIFSLLGQEVQSLDNLGIDALQAAILAYIATGGNLAGTLQSGANILKTVPGIIGAVAP